MLIIHSGWRLLTRSYIHITKQTKLHLSYDLSGRLCSLSQHDFGLEMFQDLVIGAKQAGITHSNNFVVKTRFLWRKCQIIHQSLHICINLIG